MTSLLRALRWVPLKVMHEALQDMVEEPELGLQLRDTALSSRSEILSSRPSIVRRNKQENYLLFRHAYMAAILAKYASSSRKETTSSCLWSASCSWELSPLKLCSTVTQPLDADTHPLSLRNPSLPLELGFLFWIVYALSELPFKG